MSARSRIGLLGLLLLLPFVGARADDLTGSDTFVCASMTVVACWDNGECLGGSPAELNVPQFIEIDLKGKRLRTTRASGENRSTPIVGLTREGGQIILQGSEKGRAFSFVISESSGLVSAAVATEGKTIAVFGACTPKGAS